MSMYSEGANDFDEDELEEENMAEWIAEGDSPSLPSGLESPSSWVGDEYIVEFHHTGSLGMILQREFGVLDGGRSKEIVTVKMVVASGHANLKGVKEGSLIVSINGDPMVGLPYEHVLEKVKLERPLSIKFLLPSAPIPTTEATSEATFKADILIRKVSFFITWRIYRHIHM